MATMTLLAAVRDALLTEMGLNDKIVIMGEDVGHNGGVFRATEGLQAEFGEDRVMDTPLAESGIIGMAVGMAVNGLKPVPEIQFMDFIYPAFDQIVSEVAKLRYRSGGGFSCPMVIRTPYGGGIRGGHYHSQSAEAYFAHTAGLKVVIPSNARDAKAMIKAAIRDDNPVVFLEHMGLYHGARDEIPDGDIVTPLGQAAVVREGDAVTLVAVGAMVKRALQAATVLAVEGVEAEVIDLRTIVPLDMGTVLKSVAKTGRLVVVTESVRFCGSAGEVAAIVAEEGFRSLKAPIERLGMPSVPIPFARNLEKMLVPDEDAIVAAARRTLAA